MPKKINTFYLGTAVKLTITIDVSTATSALITIDDPTEIEKISDANMTKEADGVYTYLSKFKYRYSRRLCSHI